MNAQTLLRDVESLPEEKQNEVADFIAFLRARQVRRKPVATEVARGTPSAFFGMWADREDMVDSSCWVRSLRQTDWHIHG